MNLRRPKIARGLLLLAAVAPILGAKTAAKSPPPTVEEAAPKPPTLRHGVFRFTSYPVAWTAAQESQRPILILVSSPRCPQCTRMISQTYRSTHVKKMVGDSFETVYVDPTEQPTLAAKLKVRRYPTSIVVGTNNKVMDVIEGYVDPNAFSRRLKSNLAHSNPVAKSNPETRQR